MKKIAIFTRKEVLNNKEILYIPKAVYDKFYKKVLIIVIPFDDNENYINKLRMESSAYLSKALNKLTK